LKSLPPLSPPSPLSQVLSLVENCHGDRRHCWHQMEALQLTLSVKVEGGRSRRPEKILVVAAATAIHLAPGARVGW
jgi:hypothetical protein